MAELSSNIMFTGIVEASIPVAALEHKGGLLRISLGTPPPWCGHIKVGDSVAVNGCCLTIAALDEDRLLFEAVPETLRLTNLADLKQGSLVNVERALSAGARMDGHFVQGHVDGVGEIARIDDLDGERLVSISAGLSFCAQCILKGSVCIDGISLTIAALGDTTLTVAIIPHTWKVTNLHTRKEGDRVNLEADVLGKYVRAALSGALAANLGVTRDVLKARGMAQ